MMKTGTIALIGFMAAGKTTIGQALAAKLGVEYLDTDALIVTRAGKPIPEIFAGEGEAAFRAHERAAVAEAAARAGAVISCGGGAAKDPRNVAALRDAGAIVWLRLSPATATQRILDDGAGRPLIDDHVEQRTRPQVLRRVEALMAERRAMYQAAADLIVDVDDRTIEEIVAEILAAREI